MNILTVARTTLCAVTLCPAWAAASDSVAPSPEVQKELAVLDSFLRGEFYRLGRDPEPVTNAILNLAKMGPDAAPAIPQLVDLLGMRIDTYVTPDQLALLLPDNLFVATIDGKTIVPGAIQLSAVAALVRIGPVAIEPLRAALAAEDEDAVYGAAFALVMMKNAMANQVVIDATRNTTLKHRAKIAETLGYCHEASGTAALIELASDQDADLRAGAVRGLGYSKNRMAAGPLIAALKDPSESVRFYAADGLWFLAKAGALDASALEPLVAALGDKDAGVRSNAAKALGRLKDPRGIGPLISLLSDAEISVRNQVSLALHEATGQDFGNDQARWKKWWAGQKPHP